MNDRLKSIVTIVFVLIAISVFFWFANKFGSGESVESEKPAVICTPHGAPPEQQTCYWTAHIHAHITVIQNGKEILLGFEKGNIEGQHTHSDPEQIHWHGLIPVDPFTKEVVDWSALEIQSILFDLGLSPESPTIVVNGTPVSLSYVWQDHDVIEIRYE